MIRILFGNEPYAIDARKKKLLQGIEDVTQFEGKFDAETLRSCRTFSLFSDKRGVILRADSLKALDNKTFEAYRKKESEGTVLVVIVKNADARTKIYKHLQKEGLLISCHKVEREEDFQKVILYELKREGAKITPKAMEELARRLNYFELEDMNLMRVVGYVKTLAMLSKEITEELVREHIPCFERADAFRIASLIEERNASGILHEINMLPKTDAIWVLSLVLREIRIALKLRYFNASEIGIRVERAHFMKCQKDQLTKALQIVTDGIAGIKKGLFPDDFALKTTVAEVMQMLT